jgi:hypothetical protein
MSRLWVAALATLLITSGSVRIARAAGRFVSVGGGAFTISMDAAGRSAFLVNDTLFAVLDVPSGKILRQFSTSGVSDGGPVDSTGTLLPVFGFSTAGIIDVRTGAQRNLISASAGGGAYYAAAIANGKLYAASFNGRSANVVALTGGSVAAITPYPNGTELNGDVATPCELAVSPDQGTVLMGDEGHAAIHAIRTSDGKVVATYAVGFAPCRIFFKDAQTAVAVNAGQGVWADSTGDFALIHLDDPSGPPAIRRVRGLQRLQAAAVDPRGRVLVLLYGGEPGDNEGIGTPVSPRLGVVDLTTLRTRTRVLLPRKRGFAATVALTPDGRRALVGTTLGVQYVRLRP